MQLCAEDRRRGSDERKEKTVGDKEHLSMQLKMKCETKSNDSVTMAASEMKAASQSKKDKLSTQKSWENTLRQSKAEETERIARIRASTKSAYQTAGVGHVATLIDMYSRVYLQEKHAKDKRKAYIGIAQKLILLSGRSIDLAQPRSESRLPASIEVHQHVIFTPTDEVTESKWKHLLAKHNFDPILLTVGIFGDELTNAAAPIHLISVLLLDETGTASLTLLFEPNNSHDLNRKCYGSHRFVLYIPSSLELVDSPMEYMNSHSESTYGSVDSCCSSTSPQLSVLLEHVIEVIPVGGWLAFEQSLTDNSDLLPDLIQRWNSNGFDRPMPVDEEQHEHEEEEEVSNKKGCPEETSSHIETIHLGSELPTLTSDSFHTVPTPKSRGNIIREKLVLADISFGYTNTDQNYGQKQQEKFISGPSLNDNGVRPVSENCYNNCNISNCNNSNNNSSSESISSSFSYPDSWLVVSPKSSPLTPVSMNIVPLEEDQSIVPLVDRSAVSCAYHYFHKQHRLFNSNVQPLLLDLPPCITCNLKLKSFYYCPQCAIGQCEQCFNRGVGVVISFESKKVEMTNNILFNPGYATIKTMGNSFEMMNLIARALNETSISIRVEGHINTIQKNGTALPCNSNLIKVYKNDCTALQLSECRAKAVVDYLIGEGVSASRLISVGCGGDQPLTRDPTRLHENR